MYLRVHFLLKSMDVVAKGLVAFPGDQLEDILLFLPMFDLVCSVRPAAHDLAKVVRRSSLWDRPLESWTFAAGQTQAAVDAGDWCVTAFSPAPLHWLPKPLLLLRPRSYAGAVLAPHSWPGGAPASTPGIWAGASAPGHCTPLLVVPTSCALHRASCWCHARIVVASGRWAEIQSFADENSGGIGFHGLLRWQRGAEGSDFLSQPLADWAANLDAVIYTVGHGRVEWDHPPVVDTMQLLRLAQWLRLTAGEEASLWSALMQVSRGQLLGKHMPQVRARHSKDLASEAELALRLLAECLPKRATRKRRTRQR